MTRAPHDTDPDTLLRRLVGGDPEAEQDVLRQAGSTDDARLLVASALLRGEPSSLSRARGLATTPRDRQLVALAQVHLAGDADLLAVLVRDHLVEHPDHLLAAWIAGRPVTTPEERSS